MGPTCLLRVLLCSPAEASHAGGTLVTLSGGRSYSWQWLTASHFRQLFQMKHVKHSKSIINLNPGDLEGHSKIVQYTENVKTGGVLSPPVWVRVHLIYGQKSLEQPWTARLVQIPPNAMNILYLLLTLETKGFPRWRKSSEALCITEKSD